MRKKFTTLFLFAATMLVAFSFTACSEDIMEENGGEKSAAQTIFSSGDEDTRTSINNKALFFWEKGDKIWVDGGTGYVSSSQSDITTAKQAQAKFVVDGSFVGEPIKVLYTGYTNNDTTATSYSTVTIADQQTQKAWNDGSHLGTSGDCGTALAYKKPGGYRFQLEHKASYLIIYPHLAARLTASYTLKKIEIIADGQNIAGRYNFTFENGLYNSDNQPASPIAGTGKRQITLTCQGGFQLSKDIPDVTSTTTTYRHCFVVIAPGTHQLSFRYTVTNNSTGQDVVFWKDHADTKYEPNGVYPYTHELNDPVIDPNLIFYESGIFYQWGAASEWQSSDYVYNTSATELTDGDWGTLVPSRIEAQNYVKNSVYWDNAVEWKFIRKSGTVETWRGGAWIKKAQYITEPYGTSSIIIPILGRPDENVFSQYFFLPAFRGVDGETHFWTRTPVSVNAAYTFRIARSSVGIQSTWYKHNARTSPWKQVGNGAETWWE